MKKEQNPYATNKGGMIRAPHTPAAGDPHATRTVGKDNDLRTGK